MGVEAGWVNEDNPRPERAAQFMLDRFASLVNTRGGQELPDRCVGNDLLDLTEASDPVAVATQGCGGQTRFELPYKREDGSIGKVVACASCDLGIRWPKLAVA